MLSGNQYRGGLHSKAVYRGKYAALTAFAVKEEKRTSYTFSEVRKIIIK